MTPARDRTRLDALCRAVLCCAVDCWLVARADACVCGCEGGTRED